MRSPYNYTIEPSAGRLEANLPSTNVRDFTRLGPQAGARIAICGGCGGIGQAVVRGALATGLETFVLDRPDTAHACPAGARFIGFDANDEAEVRAAFAPLGPKLDAVVNLIGSGEGPAPAIEMDLERFDRVMNRNLRTAFLISKYAVPLLKASGAGSLIHTATGAAFRAMPGTADYTAAKGGLVAFARLLAAENGPDVRVNLIAPGGVTNRVHVKDGKAVDTGGLDVSAILKALPLKRFADPDDLVGPVLFLAGPASSYITGQTLHLNGGGWMA